MTDGALHRAEQANTEAALDIARRAARAARLRGNAVPPPAAAAVASVMGQALLQARHRVAFALASTPVWVQPMAIALSLDDFTPSA